MWIKLSEGSVHLVKSNVSLVARKYVFKVSGQVRHKPACSATEASKILILETREVLLCVQKIIKVLTSLGV